MMMMIQHYIFFNELLHNLEGMCSTTMNMGIIMHNLKKKIHFFWNFDLWFSKGMYFIENNTQNMHSNNKNNEDSKFTFPFLLPSTTFFLVIIIVLFKNKNFGTCQLPYHVIFPFFFFPTSIISLPFFCFLFFKYASFIKSF